MILSSSRALDNKGHKTRVTTSRNTLHKKKATLNRRPGDPMCPGWGRRWGRWIGRCSPCTPGSSHDWPVTALPPSLRPSFDPWFHIFFQCKNHRIARFVNSPILYHTRQGPPMVTRCGTPSPLPRKKASWLVGRMVGSIFIHVSPGGGKLGGQKKRMRNEKRENGPELTWIINEPKITRHGAWTRMVRIRWESSTLAFQVKNITFLLFFYWRFGYLLQDIKIVRIAQKNGNPWIVAPERTFQTKFM